MSRFYISLFIVATIGQGVLCINRTLSPVVQCKGENFEGLKDRIKIVPCGPKKCRLPKQATIKVAINFKPEKDVNMLMNDVDAKLDIISLPFIGVSGKSACENVRRADTGAMAPCPLQAGIEYTYENEFLVEPYYPPLSHFIVHWSLKDGDENVICFEVPAAIVKAKRKKT